jgi:hypothetical protein
MEMGLQTCHWGIRKVNITIVCVYCRTDAASREGHWAGRQECLCASFLAGCSLLPGPFGPLRLGPWKEVLLFCSAVTWKPSHLWAWGNMNTLNGGVKDDEGLRQSPWGRRQSKDPNTTLPKLHKGPLPAVGTAHQGKELWVDSQEPPGLHELHSQPAG